MGLSLMSREEAVDEFVSQRLIPIRQNPRGPGLAVGDVFGNGRDDVVLGGTTRDSLRILASAASGPYAPADSSAVATGTMVDDGPVLLFDSAGTGRQDLLVTKGGNSVPEGSQEYQPYVGAQIPKLLVLYQAAGQAEVENIDGSNNELFTKGQISFIVARANMYLAASQFDLCRAELEDAYSYAFNMGYDDVADKIQLALENIHHTEDEQDADFSAEVAQALAGVLPEEVCAEISEADIDDVIGYACAELIKIGIDDPEAYLIEKGILE